MDERSNSELRHHAPTPQTQCVNVFEAQSNPSLTSKTGAPQATEQYRTRDRLETRTSAHHFALITKSLGQDTNPMYSIGETQALEIHTYNSSYSPSQLTQVLLYYRFPTRGRHSAILSSQRPNRLRFAPPITIYGIKSLSKSRVVSFCQHQSFLDPIKSISFIPIEETLLRD